MRNMELMCEKCGSLEGKIRQPKQEYANPNSIIPSSTDLVYFGTVVRCDNHIDNDMQ